MSILYMMSGCPGSGKTYWAKKFLVNKKTTYISRDSIRFSIVKNDEDYFSHENEVFKLFAKTITDNLRRGFNVIADATHLNHASRKKLIDALGISPDDYELIIIFMNTSLNTCLVNNELRSGRERVPDSALRRMFYSANPPVVTEFKNCKGVWRIYNG